ncbi:MAG: TerB family tellurite resistance protein [Rhizobiaceae bacterium]
MFNALKTFLAELRSEPETVRHFEAGDRRLAEAALMFHVVAADGVVDDDERAQMAAILSSHFDLSSKETKLLIEDAHLADMEAIDLYGFTSVLKQNLEEEERVTIVEHMWEMVYADGIVHELEDNIVWRVAELLGVSQRERIHMKLRVRRRKEEEAS